jgi:hypothetical protein
LFKSWSKPVSLRAVGQPAGVPSHEQSAVVGAQDAVLDSTGDASTTPVLEAPVADILEDDDIVASIITQGRPEVNWLDDLALADAQYATPSHNVARSMAGRSAPMITFDDRAELPSFSRDFNSLVPTPPDFIAAPSLPYCPVPWPDDMAASPGRQFLWQYFLHSIETRALCVTTIPSIAMTHSTLRKAVLCFSRFQYNELQCRVDSDHAIWAGWRRACDDLRAQLAQLQEGDAWGFLVMISACTFLHWCAPDRRDASLLQLAARLATVFLKEHRSSANIPTVYRESIMTSFRWTTVSTLCSLQPPSSVLDDEACNAIELDHREVVQNYSSSFNSWVSHPIYAFSARLVNPLLRIGWLAEMQLSSRSDDDGASDAVLESKISILEDMLLQARKVDLEVITSPEGAADPTAVSSLNEAMHAASVILFYTRFRSLPFTAPLIRRQVKIVVEEIRRTRINSRVSFATIFPLFIAGCEAVDSDAREIIKDRLPAPKGFFFDPTDVVAALEHIWEIRDLQPGLTWPHWVDLGMSVLLLSLGYLPGFSGLEKIIDLARKSLYCCRN